MKPAQKKRLALISSIFILAAVGISLLLYAMQENLNHYYSLEALAKKEMPVEQEGIRVGGMVEQGSLQRKGDTLSVTFRITDFQNPALTMHYTGILPDLFREGQGIIATGKLGADGQFYASTILAKHDENYMPAELAEDMQRAGYDHKKGQYQ